MSRRSVEQQAFEVLESIRDSFYAVDEEWRLLYVNRHAAALWGHSAEDLIGRRLWDLFPLAESKQTLN